MCKIQEKNGVRISEARAAAEEIAAKIYKNDINKDFVELARDLGTPVYEKHLHETVRGVVVRTGIDNSCIIINSNASVNSKHWMAGYLLWELIKNEDNLEKIVYRKDNVYDINDDNFVFATTVLIGDVPEGMSALQLSIVNNVSIDIARKYLEYLGR